MSRVPSSALLPYYSIRPAPAEDMSINVEYVLYFHTLNDHPAKELYRSKVRQYCVEAMERHVEARRMALKEPRTYFRSNGTLFAETEKKED